MIITARNNEKVKRLRRLMTDKKSRKEEGVYIAEGMALIQDMPEECKVKQFFVRPSDVDAYSAAIGRFPEAEIVLVSDDVFDSVSDTVTPGGIIAVLERPEPKPIEGDRIILLDGVSDAGNMGTIVRTAVARGIKTIVCVHSCVDPYSPKAVRASMSGIFKVNVIETDVAGVRDLLSDYEIVSLDMDGVDIYDFSAKGKMVLTVGNEAHGISPEIESLTATKVAIPMVKDGVESLNAAVAAGIAMYLIR